MGLKTITGAVASIGKTADEFHFSGEEMEQFASDRHEKDMVSDNWLSKSVRPMLVISFVVLFIIFSLMSANGIMIDATLIDILKSWGTMGIMFYFTSRGAEKVVKAAAQGKRIARKDERHDMRMDRRELRLEKKRKKTEDKAIVE